MRPILSTLNTYNYRMSKWLVPELSHLTKNSYSVKDSFSFVQDIVRQENKDYIMASFDIKSLFTKIPVDETVNIILQRVFSDSTHFKGIDRSFFKKILDNCTKNNIFLFNGETYIQTDGAPMGGPISPTLAEIFLCHHEKSWLDDCPASFKPVLYKR